MPTASAVEIIETLIPGVGADTGVRMATGLSPSTTSSAVASNRSRIQDQLEAAASAKQFLMLPPGTWVYSLVQHGVTGRYHGVNPTDPDLFYGLLTPPGCELILADGQVKNDRPKGGTFFYVTSHPTGGYFGWPQGWGGALRGNTVGQTTGVTPFTLLQSDIAQGYYHDLICHERTDPGVVSANWTIEGVRFYDCFNHPVAWVSGDGSESAYDLHRNIVYRRLYAEKYGEGFLMSDVDEFVYEDCRLKPLQGFTYGDDFEPSVCRNGQMTRLRRLAPIGGGTFSTGGSFVDLYGAKDVVGVNLIATSVAQGISFDSPPGQPTKQCDGIVLSNLKIKGCYGSFFGPSSYPGKVSINNFDIDANGQQANYSMVLSSVTTGSLNLRNGTIRGANSWSIQAGAKGTVFFSNVEYDGAGSLDQARWGEWNPSGAGNTAAIVADKLTVKNYITALKFTAAGTVPAGSRLDADFGGCTYPKQFPGGTVSLNNLEVIGSLMGGGNEPPYTATDTTNDASPIAGFDRVTLGGGPDLTTLTAGHKNQQVRVRFTGSRKLIHGSGNVRLAGAKSFLFQSGDSLLSRWDGTNYSEVSRGVVNAGMPLIPAFPSAAIAAYLIGPSYCYTDTGRTTQAAVGQRVALNVDSSGNGRDRIQTDASKRPYLRQDGNGLYYLEFTINRDFMVHTADPKQVVEFGWSGQGVSGDASWGNFGGFVNPASGSGRWCLTAPGSAGFNTGDGLIGVRLNDVALSGPSFDTTDARTLKSLVVQCANAGASPTGWQFGTAENNEYALARNEYGLVLYGASLSAGERTSLNTILTALRTAGGWNLGGETLIDTVRTSPNTSVLITADDAGRTVRLTSAAPVTVTVADTVPAAFRCVVVKDTAADAIVTRQAAGTVNGGTSTTVTGAGPVSFDVFVKSNAGAAAQTLVLGHSADVAVQSYFPTTPATVVLMSKALFPFTIRSLLGLKSDSPVTATVQINGTNVTGLTALSVTSTPQDAVATAANTVAVGDRVTMTMTVVSGANLEFLFTGTR